jgi:hypothetical protein
MTWQTPKTDWNSNYVPSSTDLNRIEGNQLDFIKAGISEAANGRMGLITMSLEASKEVANTSITANTRILLTVQTRTGGTTPNNDPAVSVRTPGTSFTVAFLTGNFSGTIAYLLIEPQ